MNYCAIDDIKTELDIENDTYDDIIMLDIEAVKLFIDHYCGRNFDAADSTKYYDGAQTLYIDDLASITGSSDGIFLDEDGDRTYETTMTTSDYILYPLNTTPKTKVVVDPVNGAYSGFASGVNQGVRIIAKWGYQSTVPSDVKKAAIIQSCRWFKRRESSYQDVVGTPELGTTIVYKSLDPDVKVILQSYRKYA